jgi:2,4-dienoyl-CoA reductase (NADPH2)
MPKQARRPLALDIGAWQREWGVSEDPVAVGALLAADPEAPETKVYLLQRTASPIGTRLGMTTGWIHRAALRAKNVQHLSGVDYLRIDDDGLRIGGTAPEVLAVDTVVVCAGQQSVNDLAAQLDGIAASVHTIGGADLAVEIDAKRAIDQGPGWRHIFEFDPRLWAIPPGPP